MRVVKMTVSSFWKAMGTKTLADDTVYEIPAEIPPDYVSEATIIHLMAAKNSGVDVRLSEIELRTTFSEPFEQTLPSALRKPSTENEGD